MRFRARNEERESRSQRPRGSGSISRAAKTKTKTVPRSTKRKRLQRRLQLTKQNWLVCVPGYVLLFKRFKFWNLPTGPKSYRAFRARNVDRTFEKRDSTWSLLSLWPKDWPRGVGVGWLKLDNGVHGWFFSFNKWDKFTMSNRKYKVKLLSFLRLRDLKIVFKHSLFKNSLCNIKNSVFKDWDAQRK